MATENIGLDDIMVTMLSMGFEVQDCQEAVTNGKLTVQAAIDWILAGKPGNVNSSPTPSLNLTSGPSFPLGNQSNPFVPSESSNVTPSASSNLMETDEIVSRSHLSEKQQKIKQSFEERERQEARKKVTEEKMKKKLEKERVLKEIQADREKQKLTRPSGQHQTAPPVTNTPSTNTPSTASGNVSENSNIQVRLPSGEMYREVFASSTTLNTVWDRVYQKIGMAINGYSGFMQPFPRKEFSRDEMKQSLKDLNLVPSGSLVLKKKDAKQASIEQAPPPPEAAVSEEESEEAEMEAENEPVAAHGWGRGHRVDAEEGRLQQHVAAMEEDQQGNEILNAIPGLNNHPLMNPIDGFAYQGAGQQEAQGGHVFEGFGNRLVAEGVPADHGAHLNRSAAQMAAEAAAQRYALPRVEPAAVTVSQPELQFHVKPLQDMAMTQLAHTLTDPRQRIFSIAGLPEELLQKFLIFLKKERLLKAKILHLIPSYLRKLDLDYYPYATNELVQAARIFVNLQVLSVNSSSLITDGALNCVKGMKGLKVLNLSGCTNLTDGVFKTLKDCSKLQTLCLDGTHVTDTGLTQFCNTGGTPSLQHLDLSRTVVTHSIFLYLKNLRMLKSLILKQSKISSLSGVEEIDCLENLDISETEIVTDSILCLSRHPRLCNICLSGTLNVHGDTALGYLKDMKLTSLVLPVRSSTTNIGMSHISGFRLNSLDLTNYTNINDEGILFVGQILSLRKLLLTNTKLTDDGMLHLKNLTHLEILNIDRTQVTSEGAKVVANFKTLSELSLSQTGVTDDFLTEGILNRCIHLTKLNLSRNQISNRGVEHLRVPHLLMLNLDGTQVMPHMTSVIQANCPDSRISLSNTHS